MGYQTNNEQQQRTLTTTKGEFIYTYNCSSSKCSNPSNDMVTATANNFSSLASTRQLTQLYSNSRRTATINSRRLTRLLFNGNSNTTDSTYRQGGHARLAHPTYCAGDFYLRRT